MRLLVIGDLHYAQPRAPAPATWTAARDTFYTAFMRTIHAIQADYVVALGDATQHGFVTEWEQMTVAYNVTSRPIRYILGNHDTMHVPKCTLVAVSGQPRTALQETSCAWLLFLDTTQEASSQGWGGVLDASQRALWAHAVAHCGNKPLLVFGHHSVYDTTAYSTFPYLSIEPTTPLDYIFRPPLRGGLYFCGHNHRHSIFQRAPWTFVQTAAVLDAPAVRIVDIDRTAVRIKTLSFANEPWSALAPLVRAGMPAYAYNDDWCGQQTDHQLVLPLAPL